MKRRKRDAHTKVMLVIEGLKGKPVAELCPVPQISQSLYSPRSPTSGGHRYGQDAGGRSASGYKSRHVPLP
jgi:hypothetical protein